MKRCCLFTVILALSLSVFRPSAADDGFSQGSPLQSGSLTQAMVFTIEGDFTAAGVGMRNLGYGDIIITGIPDNAIIRKAFLYWVILDTLEKPELKNGKLNEISITGILIGRGPDPCWPLPDSHFAYRADVTCLVTGNDTFHLTDFASGLTDGSNPHGNRALPQSEGAALLVVWSKSGSSQKTVVINDGSILLGGGSHTDLLKGFHANGVTATYAYAGADGQSGGNEQHSFNDNLLGGGETWDGSDGRYWDTDIFDVSDFVSDGDRTATAELEYSGGWSDCLVWVLSVLSVTTDEVDPWTIEIVKEGTSGPYNAIALWGRQYPFISFHVDAGPEATGLWYADKHPYGDGCGTYPEWKVMPIDTVGDVGRWTSISIHPSDSPSTYISFQDFLGNDVLIHQAPGPLCALAIPRDTVDYIDILGTAGTDIASDTAIGPHTLCVVYYGFAQDEQNAGELRYAEKTSPLGWNIVTIDSVGDVGKYPAIAIDTDGNRHVSYYDATNGDLKYAYCSSNCGASPANWTFEVADNIVGRNVGLFTEITVDVSRNPHISYIDSTNKSLKYANKFGGWWYYYDVDGSDPQDLIASTSIGVDDNSPPGAHISYSDRHKRALKYAYSSNTGISWNTLTVPDPWDDVGLWNSIAVGVGDTVHFSYSASDSLCSFKALKYTKGKPSW